MKYLILGLPLTGKTTYGAKHMNHVSVDYGQSKDTPDNVLKKYKKTISALLQCEADLVIDTYPDYVDFTALPDDVRIFVALPSVNDIPKIFCPKRLLKRKDTEFIEYAKVNYERGINEWLTSDGFNSLKHVTRVDMYDRLPNLLLPSTK